MKYKKFAISHYRSITGPLEVDISKESLIPIIGINECGKTTILNALFAFDSYNDYLNTQTKQLDDVHNLFKTKPENPFVGAEIEITPEEFREALESIKTDDENLKVAIKSYIRQRNKIQNTMWLYKWIGKVGQYAMPKNSIFKNPVLNNLLGKEIVKMMPYILYFDDFRDSIENEFLIEKDEKGNIKNSWLSIIECLFEKTEAGLSVFELPNMESRRRDGVISKVTDKLNSTLTREWQNFRLDAIDALELSLTYAETNQDGVKKSFIKINVIEKDADGNKHFFYIKDRSKGFFWFFNFVMKLEFNPKTMSGTDYEAIYLLDEPGSYLHATAQKKLCEKLKFLSAKNKVIYCTHSHYLLNPDVIPFNSIKIASKQKRNGVTLTPINQYKGDILGSGRQTAFQPLVDALQIPPLLLDWSFDKIVIVEGMSDFLLLSIFSTDSKVGFLPSVGAPSVHYFASLLISVGKNYRVLVDNDKDGIKEKQKFIGVFGEQEAKNVFRVLPRFGAKKTILQDVILGEDILLIKKGLGLGEETSFEKMLLSLKYSVKSKEIISKVGKKTTERIQSIFEALK